MLATSLPARTFQSAAAFRCNGNSTLSSTNQLRAQIEDLLQRGHWTDAHLCLGELWRQESKATTARFVSACYDRMRSHMPLHPCRVSFLRSMTVEPLVPILKSAALVSGIDLTIDVGGFGAYVQEILDPNSPVYSSNANLVFLAMQTRDILPEIWESYTDLSPKEVNGAVDRALQQFATWIHSFRSRTKSCLVIHMLERPIASAGLLEAQTDEGQLAAVDRFNSGLRKLCKEYRGVYALDYESLVARHGRSRWQDEGKWLATRMPFASEALLPMVCEWLKFIHPVVGVTCKALVMDLDNTIWGGVLGEVGAAGLVVDSEYPGAFYRALQRVILDLQHRGILLAICSKNDHEDALSAFRTNPGMILKPEHFAAFRINWRDKAENVAEIARELNVGTDSIAFLDDNPVERERVRRAIPDIKVITLPENPQGFAAAVRDCPLFERLSLSMEDAEHTRLYRERHQRTEFARTVGTLVDFYRSLDQEISIARVTPQTISRVAQLTQKTNQFNVTTRRHSEQEIEDLAARPGWNVYSIRVKDRFGDNGIVGVAITNTCGEICEIESLLLSCRVMGRTIETAILTFLVERSRVEGALCLQGWIIPSAKNAPVRDLYASHGFEPVANEGDAILWNLDLTISEIAQPEWNRLHFVDDHCGSAQTHA
jgi:FkbH-like protein